MAPFPARDLLRWLGGAGTQAEDREECCRMRLLLICFARGPIQIEAATSPGYLTRGGVAA